METERRNERSREKRSKEWDKWSSHWLEERNTLFVKCNEEVI